MKKNRKKKENNFFRNVKRTWKFFSSSGKNLVGYASISILEAIIGAILPLASAKIILNMTDELMLELIYSAIAVFAIELILYTVFFLKGYFFQKIYHNTLINLQSAVARETLKLEISEIDKSSSGLFIDRLNKDTEDISSMFMEYTYWISNVLSKVGVLVAIFILNKYVFVFSLISALTVFAINRARIAKQYDVDKHLRKMQEGKTSITSEIVRGIRDIKVLHAEENILDAAEKKIRNTAKEKIRMMNIKRVYGYLEEDVTAVSELLFIVFGIFLFNKGYLTIPTFVILYGYQTKVQNLLTGLVQILEYNKSFIIAADRIFEVIDDEKFAKEKFGTRHLDRLSGDVEFSNVTFCYDKDRKIINKASFHVHPNETVAFVGKSGAGKTTIFSLLTRLYHRNSGKILLDGISIDDLDLSSIRDNMSIITQNPYIFNLTIKENLQLAKKNATMTEIREACKMACIDDYIMSLPKKYNSLLGENGVILSGGQRQRIAIARALLMKTEIILLDEATSALDNETQSEISDAIANMKGEYTIMIIAHRLSTVADADRIFVVDDGRIIASGTHKELIKSSEFYKNLYEKDLKLNR